MITTRNVNSVYSVLLTQTATGVSIGAQQIELPDILCWQLSAVNTVNCLGRNNESQKFCWGNKFLFVL